jgi:hypothetical protein
MVQFIIYPYMYFVAKVEMQTRYIKIHMRMAKIQVLMHWNTHAQNFCFVVHLHSKFIIFT